MPEHDATAVTPFPAATVLALLGEDGALALTASGGPGDDDDEDDDGKGGGGSGGNIDPDDDEWYDGDEDDDEDDEEPMQVAPVAIGLRVAPPMCGRGDWGPA